MTDVARYRRIRWPNDRRGVRADDVARQLGITRREVWDLFDAGAFAFWFSVEARGLWLDADEVDAYVARQAVDAPPEAQAG